MEPREGSQEYVDPVAESDEVIADEERNATQGDKGKQLEATTE